MYENQYISIDISITDSANYIIYTSNLTITATSNTTYLNFITTILGQSHSILKQTSYTIILNSPKNTGPSAVAAVVGTVNQVIMSVVASSAASSLLAGNQPSLVWTSLNTAQMLGYVPLQNIKIPQALNDFLINLLPAGILPNLWVSYHVYECESTHIIDSFINYGFTCNYLITNTGEIAFAFVVSLSILPLLTFFYFVTRGKAKTYFLKKIKEYRWNYFIRFWIEGYLDIVIPVIISVSTVISK